MLSVNSLSRCRASLLPALQPRLSRGMAMSMEPPFIFPRKAMPRTFSKRKTFLYNRYRNIIDASTRGAPFLLLSHADFSANQLVRFRQEIADARPRGVKEPWVEADGAVPPFLLGSPGLRSAHPSRSKLLIEPLRYKSAVQ